MPSFDRGRSSGAPDSTDAAANVATECPFCWSTELATASKTITEETYWRCLACGEIWNPTRSAAAQRRAGRAW